MIRGYSPAAKGNFRVSGTRFSPKGTDTTCAK